MAAIKRVVNWLFEDIAIKTVLWRFYDWKFRLVHGKGTDVMEEDWDTLVILDACRFDDFTRENFLEGRLGSRISKGVHSKEFIIENFRGRNLHDTIYVTGNPFVKELKGDEFFYVNSRPLERMATANRGWVKPKDVTEAALDAHHRFPDKRLIVHYMQPHDPPIGERGQQIRDQYGLRGLNLEGTQSDGQRLMSAVQEGDVPTEAARAAYRENLRIALDEVEDLILKIDGRSVITADHGEMFGERPHLLLGKRFGHPLGPRTEQLSKVPWFIVGDGSGRRQTSPGTPVDNESIGSHHVEEQLEALGYC